MHDTGSSIHISKLFFELICTACKFCCNIIFAACAFGLWQIFLKLFLAPSFFQDWISEIIFCWKEKTLACKLTILFRTVYQCTQKNTQNSLARYYTDKKKRNVFVIFTKKNFMQIFFHNTVLKCKIIFC